MGLDIFQGFDLEEEDEDFEFDETPKSFDLSRSFAHLLSNYQTFETDSHFHQIETLFQVDLSPIAEMLQYTNAWELEEILEYEDEEDADQSIADLTKLNQEIAGNIDRVIDCCGKLLVALRKQESIYDQLEKRPHEFLPSKYFNNLRTTEPGNYLDNNLTQDIHAILEYSKLAKSMGSKTTFLTFG